ncbi:tetratricopeptide repeat protein [Selenomonas sp. FC4001]|uniref:tetratricopeptide repeat protein n=1 Tax=Selenomonas sp. FC4001 TaxID=1408313 RepID=UPI00056BEFD1|nr:tetratricopeptide repeat protein [Selenomonas sp. FC4001]
MQAYNKDIINKVIDYLVVKGVQLPGPEIHAKMDSLFPVLVKKIKDTNRKQGGLTKDDAIDIIFSVPKYLSVDGKVQIMDSMHIVLHPEQYKDKILSDAFVMTIIGSWMFNGKAVQDLIQIFFERLNDAMFIEMENFISMIPSVTDYIKEAYISGDIFDYRLDVFENLPKTNMSIEELRCSIKELESTYRKLQGEKQEGICRFMPLNVEAYLFNQYRLLASKGDVDALRKLGAAYEYGHYGIDKDDETARRLYVMAINTAKEKNQNNDAVLYYQEGNAYYDLYLMDYSDEYIKDAIMCWKKAARLGYPEAQHRLSEQMNDYDERIYWEEQAANNGCLVAQYNMGSTYQRGWYGVTKNDNTAAIWFKKALKGYLEEVNNHYDDDLSHHYKELGDLYYNDLPGIGKNYKEAMKWYDMAVKERAHFYENALYNMGMMYYHGWGCSQDKNKADEIYERLMQYHGKSWEPYN